MWGANCCVSAQDANGKAVSATHAKGPVMHQGGLRLRQAMPKGHFFDLVYCPDVFHHCLSTTYGEKHLLKPESSFYQLQKRKKNGSL